MYRLLGRMGSRGGEMPEIPKKEELKCELYPKNAHQMWSEFGKSYDKYDFYKGSEAAVQGAIERTYDMTWYACEEAVKEGFVWSPPGDAECLYFIPLPADADTSGQD